MDNNIPSTSLAVLFSYEAVLQKVATWEDLALSGIDSLLLATACKETFETDIDARLVCEL